LETKESVLRNRFRVSAAAAAIGLALGSALSLAAATPVLAAAVSCGCDCPDAAPAHHRHAMRRAPRSDYAESYYDYRSQSRVNEAPYTHHWEVAPEGYVPPPQADAGYGDAYAAGYGDDYRNGSLSDHNFSGGVGYGDEDGGAGGAITLAQPDGLNGPNYNNFGQSYGGSYGAANRLSAWRNYSLRPSSSNGN
jgi:hypothetical protein